MKLSAITTYPIKGCYRTEQTSAQVRPWGLAGDRRWLIVDADTGRAVTQRENARLTQIRPRPTLSGLVLSSGELGDLAVDTPLHGERTGVSLFQANGLAARYADPNADDWLSLVLGTKVRLVWQDDPTSRDTDDHPGDPVSFADGYPLLLANTASLDALNDLIAEGTGGAALPMTRFRPNLVITGGPAWIEDAWTAGRVRIGEVTFRVPKPCGRCVVTTTDQETGERGREPLATLARHRNVNQKLLFGTNMIPEHPGTLSLGDPVTPL